MTGLQNSKMTKDKRDLFCLNRRSKDKSDGFSHCPPPHLFTDRVRSSETSTPIDSDILSIHVVATGSYLSPLFSIKTRLFIVRRETWSNRINQSFIQVSRMRSDTCATYLSLPYHDQRIQSSEDVWKVKLIFDKPVALDERSSNGSTVQFSFIDDFVR